jgi:putative colanic acid biosynthesis UDP-glucose lipid carrier transferase
MPATKGQLVWTRTRLILLLGDILAVLVALRFAYVGRFVLDVLPNHVPVIDPLVLPLCLLILIVFYATLGLYNQRYVGAGYAEYTRVAAASTYALAVLVMITYLDESLRISRGFLFILWVATIAMVAGERFLFRQLLRAMAFRGHRLRRVIVVGASRQGLQLARQLARDRGASSEVAGLLDDYRPKGSRVGEFEVLGEPMELAAVSARVGATHAVVVESALSWESLRFIVRTMHRSMRPEILLAPGLYDVNATPLELTQVGPTFLLRPHPSRIVGTERMLKRGLDFGLAVPALVVTLPLQIAVMTWGWLRHGSPYVLDNYLGENGSTLRMPRLHGATIDALHLARMPALLLVVTGQMSLIGPRPVRPSASESWQETLYAMKPGFIGPWWLLQNGRPSAADDEIAVDLQYARGYTFWMDIRILWEVAMSVLVVQPPPPAATTTLAVEDVEIPSPIRGEG